MLSLKPAGPDLASDPTDPDPSYRFRPTLPPAHTLAEIGCLCINARANSALHVDIDTAVTVKPVTLAGFDNIPADQVLHALADVYGLRLSDPLPGSPVKFNLTLPDVAPPSDIAALPASLRQALPEPFLQAAHIEKVMAEEQRFTDFWRIPRSPTRPAQVPAAPVSGENPAGASLSLSAMAGQNSRTDKSVAGCAACPACRCHSASAFSRRAETSGEAGRHCNFRFGRIGA